MTLNWTVKELNMGVAGSLAQDVWPCPYSVCSMKSLTTKECIDTLKKYGVEITRDESFSQILRQAPFLNSHSTKVSMPKDSGRKVALMRLLFGRFNKDSEVLIWLKNWDIWGSSGHKPLANRLRQALGCNQELEEAPGHLFSAADADDILSFLFLSAEFFWDCLALSADLRVTVFLSHDEYCQIVCKEKQDLLQIQDVLEKGNWTK